MIVFCELRGDSIDTLSRVARGYFRLEAEAETKRAGPGPGEASTCSSSVRFPGAAAFRVREKQETGSLWLLALNANCELLAHTQQETSATTWPLQ